MDDIDEMPDKPGSEHEPQHVRMHDLGRLQEDDVPAMGMGDDQGADPLGEPTSGASRSRPRATDGGTEQ